MSTKETNSTKHFFNHNDVFGQHSLNCMMSLRHIEKADNLYKKFKKGPHPRYILFESFSLFCKLR